MLAGAVCERCLEKSLPCSGPTDTPQRLEKLEKSQEMKGKHSCAILGSRLTHFSDVSGDPLRLVQVTRVSGKAGTTIRWLKPPFPPQIASGELHVYQQVSFGGPIETEVVTGEVNLIIEESQETS